jgi:hypothetical protein
MSAIAESAASVSLTTISVESVGIFCCAIMGCMAVIKPIMATINKNFFIPFTYNSVQKYEKID